MFDRILILSASVGNGHTTAAQALKSTFEREGLAAEVRHEDVLKFTNPLFRRLYGKATVRAARNRTGQQHAQADGRRQAELPAKLPDSKPHAAKLTPKMIPRQPACRVR